MTINTKILLNSELGKETTYPSVYTPELLFPIERKTNRKIIGVPSSLPFYGCDIWNTYELSWLNPKGKPKAAIGEIVIPCTSSNLIESKSFKLYLNSFNQTKFDNIDAVCVTIEKDLFKNTGSRVKVNLTPLSQIDSISTNTFEGQCLDNLDILTDEYSVNPNLLIIEPKEVDETVYSDLLKSNCPVTNQPDWASVRIHYIGPKINSESLLKYIISYRCHNEFHEQCVERIFMDIQKHCKPSQLTVEARYTRRGGLDINPIRSTHENLIPENIRLIRQ